MYVGDKAKKVLVSVNVTSLDMVAMVTPGVWQVAALTVDSQYIYFTAWDKRCVAREYEHHSYRNNAGVRDVYVSVCCTQLQSCVSSASGQCHSNTTPGVWW